MSYTEQKASNQNNAKKSNQQSFLCGQRKLFFLKKSGRNRILRGKNQKFTRTSSSKLTSDMMSSALHFPAN